MKIPLVNTDAELLSGVSDACGQLNREMERNGIHNQRDHMRVVPIHTSDDAIEYINYQMPQLIIINFSDSNISGMDIMREIVADPWLNNGGIVALYDDLKTLDDINELENTNIVISAHKNDVKSQLYKILSVLMKNEKILFQRTIQKDLLSEMSGIFDIGNDVTIISFYANLIANYLYNMGFIENQKKSALSLCFTEILINAIEHGNCGITSQEKTGHLAKGETIHSLIERKCQDPEIANRRVYFHYQIQADHSQYIIRDEGTGFDWKPYVRAKEIDYLSEHGRGIWLTVNSVDSIDYNDVGNEVTMRVTHRQNVTNTVPSIFGENEIVEFQPGDYVFKQGEESTFLYYIAEGEYRVVINETQIATVNSADIFIGEMAFLLEETRSAAVIANTPGKLIKIPKESFIRSIKQQPYYGIFLSKLLAERLQKLGEKIRP